MSGQKIYYFFSFFNAACIIVLLLKSLYFFSTYHIWRYHHRSINIQHVYFVINSKLTSKKNYQKVIKMFNTLYD
jgi:hypothetical protein